MRNVGATNTGQRDGSLTTEQGRIMEDMSVELVRLASQDRLVVANRQIELPEGFPMTGHPDGQVVPRELAHWDDRCAVCGDDPVDSVPCTPARNGHVYKAIGWVAPLDATVDGLVTGFEHKHLGRWGFTEIFKQGFAESEPGYYAQTLAYGDALNWDRVMVVVLGQDSSSVQGDYNINLGAKNPKVRWSTKPGWHPKLQIVNVDLGSTVNYQKRLRFRAEQLTKWLFEDLVDPSEIVREADPTSLRKETPVLTESGEVEIRQGPDFPCSHCPWLTRCLSDGEGRLHAAAMAA